MNKLQNSFNRTIIHEQGVFIGHKLSMLLLNKPLAFYHFHCSTSCSQACHRQSVPELSPLLVCELGISYPYRFVKWTVSRRSSAI